MKQHLAVLVLMNKANPAVTVLTHTQNMPRVPTVRFFHSDSSCPSNVAHKTLCLRREHDRHARCSDFSLRFFSSFQYLKPFQMSSQLERTTALCGPEAPVPPFFLDTLMVAALQDKHGKHIRTNDWSISEDVSRASSCPSCSTHQQRMSSSVSLTYNKSSCFSASMMDVLTYTMVQLFKSTKQQMTPLNS